MQAFHNDPAMKAFYLARVRAHRRADELIHGTYWARGKGCAVGCTIHGCDHRAYEHELGIPRILGHLEDGIFEGLPHPDDQAWPETFLDAIPVGSDLAGIWPRFASALFTDPAHGILRSVQGPRHTRQKHVIEESIAFYHHWVKTGIPPASAASVAAAAYAAAAAADVDAYAAATAAAAAYVAPYAAAAAAAVASAAAEAAAAKHQARQWQAATLLQLLREAPVPLGLEAYAAPHA
jgi:hypothetical protein